MEKATLLDYLTDGCKKKGCDGKYIHTIYGGGTCNKCGDREPCF